MKHSPFRVAVTGVILVIPFLAGCAVLGEPEKVDGYGAVAFSESTQRWHIRWNVSDQISADDLAAQYCGENDCSIILRYGPGQCGTFSLGDGGALGTGSGNTAEAAKSAALAECSLSGQTCKVAPVRCNDQS